jgi:hypothetical protein
MKDYLHKLTPTAGHTTIEYDFFFHVTQPWFSYVYASVNVPVFSTPPMFADTTKSFPEMWKANCPVDESSVKDGVPDEG